MSGSRPYNADDLREDIKKLDRKLKDQGKQLDQFGKHIYTSSQEFTQFAQQTSARINSKFDAALAKLDQLEAEHKQKEEAAKKSSQPSSSTSSGPK